MLEVLGILVLSNIVLSGICKISDVILVLPSCPL